MRGDSVHLETFWGGILSGVFFSGGILSGGGGEYVRGVGIMSVPHWCTRNGTVEQLFMTIWFLWWKRVRWHTNAWMVWEESNMWTIPNLLDQNKTILTFQLTAMRAWHLSNFVWNVYTRITHTVSVTISAQDSRPAGGGTLTRMPRDSRFDIAAGAGRERDPKSPGAGPRTPAPDLLRERESHGTELDYLVPHQSRTRKQFIAISFY